MMINIKNRLCNVSKKYITFENFLFLLKNHRLALLGGIGLVAGIIFTFTKGSNVPTPSNHLSLPPSSPFKQNISGTGFVEANSRNISIGSFTASIVREVYVREGDIVKEGDPLFQLDNRTALAEAGLRKKQVEAAESSLEVTRVELAESHNLLKRAEKMKSSFALSQEELDKRQFAVQKLTAQVKLQESELEQAKAQLDLAIIALDKLTVQAPVEGLIMKVGVRAGESVNDSVKNSQALILMGNHIPLYLRVQIDENDGWRFLNGSKAYAYLKSNKNISFPLKFIRIEPYAQQKKKLGGGSSELVDTRIIECVYEIEGRPKNIYIGQQMDVFIEADVGP